MIITKWEIEHLANLARTINPLTLVGRKVNYMFTHAPVPGTPRPGVCGLFGLILAQEPGETEADPMTLTIAYETSIEDFYVTQEGLRVYRAPTQHLPVEHEITLVEADRAQEIIAIVYNEHPEEDQ